MTYRPFDLAFRGTLATEDRQHEMEYRLALLARRERAAVTYRTTPRLSAEPRGNEIDLRRKAVR